MWLVLHSQVGAGLASCFEPTSGQDPRGWDPAWLTQRWRVDPKALR